MPELPEVQTIVNDLNAVGLCGTKIIGSQVFWPRSLAQPSLKIFAKRIKGKKVSAIWRRGKYIVFDLTENEHLLIHLRMSGRLNLVSSENARLTHEHVIIHFNDGRQLRLHDTRKFGRIHLVKDPKSILDRLGIEPLAPAFTVKNLRIRLNSCHRQIKPLMLDQKIIAGLGNIYVDESLWEAKIHPRRISSTLSEKETRALHRAIRTVLKRGLKNMGTTLGAGGTHFYSISQNQGQNQRYLKVFRRTGLQCIRCKTKVERMLIGQRSTHFCPACQN